MRWEDSLTEPREDWRGWAVGGRSLEPTLLHHSGGTSGVAIVPAMGHGAEWVLHPTTASASGLHPADVWAGRGLSDREVLGAEPGIVGSVTALESKPTIIFRYDVIPGPLVFETQIHGRRFQMYNDTVLGFNKSGKEAVRQQVEEPIYIRPAERATWL